MLVLSQALILTGCIRSFHSDFNGLDCIKIVLSGILVQNLTHIFMVVEL